MLSQSEVRRKKPKRRQSRRSTLLVVAPFRVLGIVVLGAVFFGGGCSSSSKNNIGSGGCPAVASVTSVSAFSVEKNQQLPPVVVAGAGPASLLFSLRFLQLNKDAKVEIYEKRPEPPRYSSNAQHSVAESGGAFGMGIGSRAQDSLDKVPGLLEAVGGIAQPLTQPPGSPGSSWMVDRNDLCAEMVHQLREVYGSRVVFHFGCTIEGVRQSENKKDDGSFYSSSYPTALVTTGGDGGGGDKTTSVPYSLLIGADGTHSMIRTTMVRKGKIKGKRYLSGSSWKALQLPAQPQMISNDSGNNNNEGVGTRSSNGYKTQTDTGRLLPLFKDRFVLLNFRNRKLPNHDKPFDASTPLELKNSIQKVLPGVTEFPSDETLSAFLNRPAGNTFYMHLNKHYIPEYRTILLGDAAVGVYNFLGQGCAYALLSANRLAEELAEATAMESSSREPRPTATVESAVSRAAERNRSEGKALADLNLIVHLTKAKFPNRFKGWLFKKVMRMSGLNSSSPSYGEIKKTNKWAIRLSRPLWILSRTKVPLKRGNRMSQKK